MCLDGIGACSFAGAGKCVRTVLGEVLQRGGDAGAGLGTEPVPLQGDTGDGPPSTQLPLTPATWGQEQAGQKDKRAEVRLGVSGDRLPEPCLKVTSS